MKDNSESFGNRRKATDEMRSRAEILEREARHWRSLASAIDRIEEDALVGVNEGCEGSHPYIGVGSDAENFLWVLASQYQRK